MLSFDSEDGPSLCICALCLDVCVMPRLFLNIVMRRQTYKKCPRRTRRERDFVYRHLHVPVVYRGPI